jgi:hypothetical protein
MNLKVVPVCESSEADQGVPIFQSVWTMILREQASSTTTSASDFSRDNLLSDIFQRSAFSKSFHIQAINPFKLQPKATIWPMIGSFLQNVNNIYYLVNPNILWSHLNSVLDTTLETPNFIMSMVCVCIALGCQACATGTLELAIMWYENGRRYLDDCDWRIEPAIMQILALISMFHMAQRPATSSHYLGSPASLTNKDIV